MNSSGRPPACTPVLPTPVRRCISRRNRGANRRPNAANDQCNDNVDAVIRFYLSNNAPGADGTELATQALARSLREFFAPEGRPAHSDELADRIAFLSCMFEDILVTAPPPR